MLAYLFEQFTKPFKSRLFKIIFLLIFIPIGTFGIHYKFYTPQYTGQFWELFTPESMFTYLVPLIVTIVIDGVITLFNSFKNINKSSYEYELLRDCSVLSVITVLICIFFIYLSLTKSSATYSFVTVGITWILWIMLSAGKDEFSPSSDWRPNGTEDDTTIEAITNG